VVEDKVDLLLVLKAEGLVEEVLLQVELLELQEKEILEDLG
jgi:hypothetical protein